MLKNKCLKDNFKDYSDDFKKNRKATSKILKNLYPTPNNLLIEEKQFLVMWDRFFSSFKLFEV